MRILLRSLGSYFTTVTLAWNLGENFGSCLGLNPFFHICVMYSKPIALFCKSRTCSKCLFLFWQAYPLHFSSSSFYLKNIAFKLLASSYSSSWISPKGFGAVFFSADLECSTWDFLFKITVLSPKISDYSLLWGCGFLNLRKASIVYLYFRDYVSCTFPPSDEALTFLTIF